MVAPFQSKVRRGCRGRKNLLTELQKHINLSSKTIWFHCASLGEFEQARPLIERTRKEFSHYDILLSFFSPSGYEIMKNYDQAHYVCYLPIDTPKDMRRFIEFSRAVALILVKYEFWPNMILQAYKKKLPIYSISAVFRKNQLFFKPYGKFMINILKKITHFFVQEENSRLLLESIGIKCVTISGDTRFDRVVQVKDSFKPLIDIERFKNDQLLIVAGSTWPDDENLLAQWIKIHQGKVKLLLAPHEVYPERIAHLRSQLSTNHVLYSEISNKEPEKYSIMILDCIGLLTRSYGSADIAYTGGGFQKSGIHNILEAATFAIPVLFGPVHHKAIEAKTLLQRKGVFAVDDLEDLTTRLDQLIKNHSLRNEMGGNAQKYVRDQRGATEKILRALKKKL